MSPSQLASINAFFAEEYGSPPMTFAECAQATQDFTRLDVAYTEREDDGVPIQVWLDMRSLTLHRTIGDIDAEVARYGSLESAITDLAAAGFDELIRD